VSGFDWSSITEISMPADVDKETRKLKKPSSAEQSRINQELERLGRVTRTELQDKTREVNAIGAEIKRVRRRAVQSPMAGVVPTSLDTVALSDETVRQLRILAWTTQRAAFARSFERNFTMDKLGKAAVHAWTSEVAALFAASPITTTAQFMRVLANVQVIINETILKGNRLFFRRVAAERDRLNYYKSAVELLGRRHFTLWVNSNGIVPPILENKQRMRGFAEILKDTVQLSIYKALEQAIDDCVSGLDKNAWPPVYTQLLKNRVAELRSSGGKKLKITGHSLSTWRISLDFDVLFGSYRDLMLAFHRGALIAGDSEKRVKIPYFGQEENLKQPEARIRYKYWSAMAQGKRVFYGGYSSKRKAIRGNRGRLQKNMDLKNAEKVQLGLDFRKLNKKKDEAKRDAVNAKLQAADENLAVLQSHRDNVATETKPIAIPAGLWEATIQDRFDFWNKERLAPVWQYLEYGQLEWAPVIPPRGLTFKFFSIARGIVDKEVERLMKIEFASTGVNTAGVVFHPTNSSFSGTPRATGTPIRFGSRYGVANRPGTFVGQHNFDNMMAAMSKGDAITRRNIAEAERVAGKFSGGSVSRTPQPFTDSASRGFWSQIYDIERVERITPNREYVEFFTKKGGIPSYRSVSPTVRSTNFGKGPTAQNFGQRMASLKKLKNLRAEQAQAARLGMSNSSYRTYKAKQEARAAKSAATAKRRAAKEKIRLQLRAKAARAKAKKKKK
jgi:hypothetical protein